MKESSCEKYIYICVLGKSVLYGNAFAILVSMGGCSSEQGDSSITAEEAAAEFETPDEVTWQGQSLLRIDSLSDEQLEAIRSASLRPGLSEKERLAEELRPLVNYHGVPYIGAEPALALAEKILAEGGVEREPVPEALPLEGRRILGSGAAAGDQRVHRAAGDVTPWTHTGFSEIGCTMTLIGNRTAVTAAHCVYTTLNSTPPVAGEVGWLCQDGSNSGGIGIGCGVYPRFAFGVEDTTHTLPNPGWLGRDCWVAAIPTAFDTDVNKGSSSTDRAKHDYAVIDFSSCFTNMGLGHIGNHPGVSVAGLVVNVWGYPQYATCPQNAAGIATDCSPETNNRYADGTKPFIGAELWGNSTGAAAVAADSGVLTSVIDVTKGDSGAALFYPHASLGFQLIGIGSNHSANQNFFKRWTTATSGFAAANSDFPADL